MRPLKNVQNKENTIKKAKPNLNLGQYCFFVLCLLLQPCSCRSKDLSNGQIGWNSFNGKANVDENIAHALGQKIGKLGPKKSKSRNIPLDFDVSYGRKKKRGAYYYVYEMIPKIFICAH